MEPTMTDRMPAEVFPPGSYIEEELDARGWPQVELAGIMGRSPKEIHDLITGKRPITPNIAEELGAALGPDGAYWWNLESAWRRWHAAQPPDRIARLSFLHQLAPIPEMGRRHWLELSDSVDILEKRVMRYFGIPTLNDPIKLSFAARRPTRGDVSPAQRAWFFRAKELAPAVQAKPFSQRSFERGLLELKSLLLSTPEVRRVPRVLSDAGIRFLVLEQLPKTKIDGAAFWLGKSPVIALSLRYDRIDHFWYTLAHELGHIKDGHEELDADIFGEGAKLTDDDAEKQADSFAQEFLVKQSDLEVFIMRTAPLYGKPDILTFAHMMRVHPGIVVGQLQHRKEIEWNTFRPMLEAGKVRQIIVQSALTDGWGQLPPALA